MSNASDAVLVVAALVAFVTPGCCACGSSSGPAPTVSAVSAVPGAAISWPDGPPSNAAAITSALAAGYDAYVAAYGAPSRQVREVVLWRRAHVPEHVHARTDGPFRGWTRWGSAVDGGAVIHLAIGQPHHPTRWWLHELHHADVGDGDHARGDWLAVNVLDLAEARRAWGVVATK